MAKTSKPSISRIFFPRFGTIKDSEFIEVAVKEINENIKEDLVRQPHTVFFAQRRLQGINTDFDQRAQSNQA